jgi:hypothetical protein
MQKAACERLRTPPYKRIALHKENHKLKRPAKNDFLTQKKYFFVLWL